ncbi:MAG: PQQ-dependent sugar dehydrogenase [Pseudomonadota bacterium]
MPVCFAAPQPPASPLPLKLLRLPKGFSIEIYAYPVPGARSLTLGEKGTVFVGTRENGKVYAIVPDTTAAYHTRVITLADGLNSPNGVAFYKGDLYVAEISRLLRMDNIEERLANPPEPVVIKEDLPTEAMHGWRYIGFNPDGKLYITLGMPCNVCQQADERYGTIMRMDPDGSNVEIFAKGIRNSEGFDWDPIDRKLWFTDNGRDWMGDNSPPDKLDSAMKGMNFGFPFYDGADLPDPEFGKFAPFKTFTPPTLELPAHVAPLGMRFYTGTQFPSDYRNQIFIAEHGSWNRSSKVGYQITLVTRTGTKPIKAKPFITGWLQNQQAWGRPVDVLVMPDGALLISDDLASVVYRVSYR